jgi:uncharacterized membrane-anchored protein
MTRREQLLSFGGLALTLGLVNVIVLGKERLRRSGTVVLLALAPRDPRSLMQGDYMALEYELARALAELAGRRGSEVVFVRRDARGVATSLRRPAPGERPGADEWPLRVRWRGDGPRVAPDAYHFQEGRAAHFAQARYAELRVDEDGTALLVGLRDEQLRAL